MLAGLLLALIGVADIVRARAGATTMGEIGRAHV